MVVNKTEDDQDLLVYNDSMPDIDRENKLRDFVQGYLKNSEPFTDTSFPPQ